MRLQQHISVKDRTSDLEDCSQDVQESFDNVCVDICIRILCFFLLIHICLKATFHTCIYTTNAIFLSCNLY